MNIKVQSANLMSAVVTYMSVLKSAVVTYMSLLKSAVVTQCL